MQLIQTTTATARFRTGVVLNECSNPAGRQRHFPSGTSIPPAAVVAAALVAGLVAAIGHWVNRSNAKLQAQFASQTEDASIRQARENAQLQTRLAANLKLAEFRQVWINSLRDDMAHFQSYGVTPNLDQIMEREFYRLGTRIELFMNPGDPDFDELQSALYDFLMAEEIGEKYAANPRFVAVCQRILKREWDVLKSEVKNVDTLGAAQAEN
jgi:hypothetical protein